MEESWGNFVCSAQRNIGSMSVAHIFSPTNKFLKSHF